MLKWLILKDLIARYKPVIIAESFGKASNADKIELYEVISQHGYDIYYFEDFDTEARVQKLSNKNDMVNYTTTINIYAIPKK